MNHPSKHLIRGTLLAGLVAGLTGCIIIKINEPPESRAHQDGKSQRIAPRTSSTRPDEYVGFENPPPPGHVWGPYTRIDHPSGPPDPAGNSGTLIIPTSSFLGGGYTCFPSAQGWDRYFVITNFILGPNAELVPNCFTNKADENKVTVRTCDSSNGTSLKTGIVIQNLDDLNGDKKCVTNSPSCLASTNLTVNQRKIATMSYYRATIFYQSSTVGSLTSVTVIWSYP